MRAIIPPRLRAGDCIGIIAPASAPKSVKSLEQGIAYLEKQGFHVKLGPSLSGGTHSEGYLSAPDTVRAADINRMFADRQVQAIFCARGGYGAVRILPKIDYALARKNPKILVGFSDITALHMAFFTKAGLVTFAGPMVAVEMRGPIDPYTEERFWDALMRPSAPLRIGIPDGKRLASLRPGTAEGTLLGGNLALLASLCGGEYLPRDWSNALLFLEDVGEKVYRIDRYLAQIEQSGILPAVSGMLIGAFSEITADSPSRTLDEVLRDYAGKIRGPVLRDFPFGHTLPKCTVPVGLQARISSRNGVLTLLQPAVS